jgi:hypothetical protein
MRKLAVILLVFISLSAMSAPRLVNRWWDSTWFGNIVQFDTTIVMKGLKVSGVTDTFVVLVSPSGKLTKVGKSTFLAGLSGGGGGTGTVTSVSVSSANGVSGTVANATTTPAITLSLGAITPLSVAATGTITGSNLLGTNTGDQDLSAYLTSSAASSNYSTKTALNDSANVLRGLIPDVSGYATKTALNDTSALLRSLIPNVSGYATITNLKDSTALVRGLITSSIPTFSLSKSTNRDSIVTLFNGTRTAIKDSSIVTPTFTLSKNATRDSIVTVYNGTRSAVFDSSVVLTNYVTNTKLSDSLSTKTNKLISFTTYTSSDTLRLTDADKVVEMNSASANNIVIPTNSAYAFPVGTQIVIIQIGAGQTTFVPASGVTVRSSSSKLKLTGQYSTATIIKRATNEWYLQGDITN